MTAPGMVTLRTGDVVPVGAVVSTRITLRTLQASNPTALMNLVDLAYNPRLQLSPETTEVLIGFELLKLGRLHDDTAAVVRASYNADLSPAVAS